MSRLTPFYKCLQKPHRVGIYQRKLDKCTLRYNYWDGEKWYFSGDTPERAFKNYQNKWLSRFQEKQWRDLAEEPI